MWDGLGLKQQLIAGRVTPHACTHTSTAGMLTLLRRRSAVTGVAGDSAASSSLLRPFSMSGSLALASERCSRPSL